jgi:hypothetical protein
MKKWMLLIFAGLALLLVVPGCGKGGAVDDPNNNGGGGPHIDNPADVTPPVVEIHTPAINQHYTSGTAINVTGKVTDGDGLYRGSIRIVNDANSTIVKEQQYEIHGILQYNFNISHTASVTIASDYTVTVSFEDHGQNITTRSVKIKVNP